MNKYAITYITENFSCVISIVEVVIIVAIIGVVVFVTIIGVLVSIIKFFAIDAACAFRKYQRLNSSDGGNIGDRVKNAGWSNGSGDEIVKRIASNETQEIMSDETKYPDLRTPIHRGKRPILNIRSRVGQSSWGTLFIASTANDINTFNRGNCRSDIGLGTVVPVGKV
ncbi:hypothetical protein Tco_0127997 [Tanacetum coccineum]